MARFFLNGSREFRESFLGKPVLGTSYDRTPPAEIRRDRRGRVPELYEQLEGVADGSFRTF